MIFCLAFPFLCHWWCFESADIIFIALYAFNNFAWQSRIWRLFVKSVSSTNSNNSFLDRVNSNFAFAFSCFKLSKLSSKCLMVYHHLKEPKSETTNFESSWDGKLRCFNATVDLHLNCSKIFTRILYQKKTCRNNSNLLLPKVWWELVESQSFFRC